jgi:MFS family permease
MYQLEWAAQLRSRKTPVLSRWCGLSPTVWQLGYTSFFTDVSSEMVSSILPVYFVLHLHFSPLQFGVLDGIYQGAAVALLSLTAGVYADRRHLQKEVATAGYALSAVTRLALFAAGSVWPLVAGVLVLDRVGKGIRTAPRDAMISLCGPRGSMATAFAVHRGLDAAGAVAGPLSAYLLLRLLPGSFDVVLVASACIAMIGLGIIGLLVEKPQAGPAISTERPSFRLSSGLRQHSGFVPVVLVGGVLCATTASDGFIYLMIQRNTNSPATMIPLFAFITALFYMVCSVPAGWLADRWGRQKVFLFGYAIVAAIYGILLVPGLGNNVQFAVLVLFGVYYAATDGVLAALASTTLSPELRTSGLALMNTIMSLSKFVSSVLFGWMWFSGTRRTPLWFFLAVSLASIVLSGVVLARRSRQ